MAHPIFFVEEKDKYARFDLRFYRFGDGRYFVGYKMGGGWSTADGVGQTLARQCDRSLKAKEVIAELTEKGWPELLPPVLEKLKMLKESEAALAASVAVVTEAKTNVLIAFYQGWVSRRGAEFLSQEDRYYWCCWDYLSFIHGDLHRTDEDFPLRYRHYNALHLASLLKNALVGEVRRPPDPGA